jgi:hypothetical protein
MDRMDCRPINGWTNWFYTQTTVGDFFKHFLFKKNFPRVTPNNIRIVGLIPGTTGHEKYMPA